MGRNSKSIKKKLSGFGDKTKKYADAVYFASLLLFIACYACNLTATPPVFFDIAIRISAFGLMVVAVYRLLVIMFDNLTSGVFSFVLGVASLLLVIFYFFTVSDNATLVLSSFAYALIGAMRVKPDLILYSGIGGNVLMILYNIVISIFKPVESFEGSYQLRHFFYLGKDWFYAFEFNNSSTTDMAAHYFWIVAAYLWIRGKKITWAELVAILGLDALVYSLTGSNCSLICISVAIICAVVYKLIVDKKISAGLTKTFSFLAQFSFVICAVVTIGLAVLYDTGNPIFIFLDKIFDERLGFGHRAFMEYGIHMYAPDVPSYGMFSSVDGFYNFIDCSYISLLIKSGIVIFVFFLVIVTMVQIKYRKYIYGTIIFAVCAVSCILEHHLSELPYNFFMLLIMADSNIDNKLADVSIKATKKGSEIIGYSAGVLFVIAAVCINIPRYKALHELNRLDDKACSIYIAVQSNMDSLTASGNWQSQTAQLSSYQYGDILDKPEDFERVTGMNWNDAAGDPHNHAYYKVIVDTDYSNASDEMLDLLISDEVRSLIGSGSVIIEYDVAAGRVYSVWYSESSGCYVINGGREYNRAERLKSGVIPEGYYAGGING